MATLETTNRDTTPYDAGVHHDEAKCLYCGAPVSRKQYREIKARIETEERARVATVEEALKQRFAREFAQAEAKKATEIEKAKRDAAKTAELQIRALQASQNALIKARVEAERETAAKKLSEAVSAEKVKAFEEKTKLTEQLAEMQRRLEKKTAHELGEPAEVNLYEALRAEFPDDQISRVVKGVKGPDIILEVVQNGTVVGSIAIDSKNHARWQNTFVQKLRADQIAEGADFAILSTVAFPKGARQLHIQDNVIVADPARVVALVHLLRRQVIQNHVLKLSAEARNEKADKLYAFIISPSCTDLLDRLVKLTDEMVALDAKEAGAHETVWKKRADLIRSVQAVQAEFSTTIGNVIGGP
jgi:hypothetical protein